LTCHFLILAVDIGSLTSSVIELGFTALLVFAVSLAALFQPRLITMFIAAVALAAIARAADAKNPAAFMKSTHSPAYLDWQR
jgi:hypothetical protein